ncbi:MAG: redoxin domain-containing protein [Planctomycetes bacterium]|nr:redoxin domain-containing protein [Planctomycetota bacterium]
MKRRTSVLGLMGLVGLIVAALGMTAGTLDQGKAKLGEKAPNFTLTDTNGQERSLSDYKGRIVVIEWINPECPDVRHCYQTKAMQGAYKKVKQLDKGVAWLAVNSTQGTTAQANKMWISKYDLKYPFLLDKRGMVGRLYDARRTPHMFVIDKEGVIRYTGAIDDNRLLHKRPEEITNYVVNAVKQLVEGETLTPDSTKPYGCTIKYSR